MTIKIGINEWTYFSIDTVAPEQGLAALNRWFELVDTSDLTQDQIDKLTARVAAANDKLQTAVAGNTPSS